MQFRHTSDFDCPVERLFGYHEQAGAISRLIPPWENITVAQSNDSLDVGSMVKIQSKLGPVTQNILAKHTEYRPNELFVDQMLSGPFATWKHEHRFESLGDARSKLTDSIEYQLPMAPMSNLLGGWVENKLQAMFRFRHRITADDLQFSQTLKQLGFDPKERSIKIGISGSSGMIGRRTIELARVLGIEVIRSERQNRKSKQDVRWPRGVQSAAEDHLDAFENLDAWIHLGGVGIADRRWSDRYKQAIRSSRVESTSKLVDRLGKLNRPPKVLVCASGVGIYGDRGEELLDEKSSVDRGVTGDDFLADVARQWESSARAYENQGGRVALARFAMVLHPRHGALSKLLLPFQLGVGGPMGDGKQYWPWVHVDDAASILLYLAADQRCQGPFNVSAPECLTNREFSRVLAKVLRRPSWLPAPGFALRMALGQMADSLLLASAQAVPRGLMETGYRFRFGTLEGALGNLLGRR